MNVLKHKEWNTPNTTRNNNMYWLKRNSLKTKDNMAQLDSAAFMGKFCISMLVNVGYFQRY